MARDAIMAQRFFVPVERVTSDMLKHFEYKIPRRMQAYADQLQLEICEDKWLTYTLTVEQDFYAFHRGDLLKLSEVFKGIPIIDTRCKAPLEIDLKLVRPQKKEFNEEKWSAQKDALSKFLEPNVGGIFVAPPAFGKTVVLAALIVVERYKTLIIVNKRDLMTQIRDTLKEFTNIEELEAAAGKPLAGPLSFKRGQFIHYPITYTTYQLFNKHREELKSLSEQFGLVMVDECHHTPAESVRFIVSNFNPMLRVGVTATPERKDGLDILLPDILGPIRFEDDKQTSCQVTVLQGIEVKIPSFINSMNYRWIKGLNKIHHSVERNNFVAEEVAKDVLMGHKTLLLTNLRAHAWDFSELLKNKGIVNEVVLGGGNVKTKDAKVKAVLKRVNAAPEIWSILKCYPEIPKEKYFGVFKLRLDAAVKEYWEVLSPEHRDEISYLINNEVDVIIATWQKFGEGSDCPMLSSVHIATPTANKPFLKQIIGRAQRPVEGKLPTKAVYYADWSPQIPQFYGCRRAVLKLCKDLGFEVNDLSHVEVEGDFKTASELMRVKTESPNDLIF